SSRGRALSVSLQVLDEAARRRVEVKRATAAQREAEARPLRHGEQAGERAVREDAGGRPVLLAARERHHVVARDAVELRRKADGLVVVVERGGLEERLGLCQRLFV